jgi:trk system potassium uptake protein TrkH
MESTVLNWKFIFRVSGIMLMIESIFIFITAGVSFYFEETPVPFILSGIITLACGLTLSLPTKIRVKIRLIGKKESFITVTLSWLLFALFGSLPFLISGKIPSFPNAFFESASGITTTGASILTDVEIMPKSILFWRSLLQWLGGMGIIVFSLAILPLLGGEAAQLFSAESTVSSQEKFRPRVAQMAKRLWGIYLTLTVLLIALLYFCQMDIFDAVCHAFSTISTGGFSTKNLSVSYWHSASIEAVLCVFMLIGSLNFSLLYFLFNGKFKKIFFDEELRWFLSIIFITTLIVTLGLYIHPVIDIPMKDNFRAAIFQVISVISTTGFYTGDYIQWGTFFWIIFLILMIICGCSGSTTAGLKTVRIVILIKNTFGEFKRLLNPRAIIPIRMNGRALSFEVVQRLLAFVFLYIFIIFFSWGIFVLAGLPFGEALSVAVTSIGNGGAGFGDYGPTGSFANIPVFVKFYMALLMIVGRLEIFTVLILFTPGFWKK